MGTPIDWEALNARLAFKVEQEDRAAQTLRADFEAIDTAIEWVNDHLVGHRVSASTDRRDEDRKLWNSMTLRLERQADHCLFPISLVLQLENESEFIVTWLGKGDPQPSKVMVGAYDTQGWIALIADLVDRNAPPLTG